MSVSDQSIIQQTKNWISQIVIDLQLCPFASVPFNTNSIDYTVIPRNDIAKHLHQIANRFSALDNDTNIETQLLIFPDAYQDFEDYLDIVYLANQILQDLKYTGIFQLASFHPSYRFADSSETDAANYSNRSPYPMLHILREESLEKAIASHPNVEQIPMENTNRLNEIGYSKMQERLEQITEE